MDPTGLQTAHPCGLSESASKAHNIADFLEGPYDAMVTGLVGATQHDPDLAQAWNERLLQPTRAANRRRLSAAQDAGHLRRTDPDALADLLAGPIWFGALVTGTVPDRKRIDTMIEAVTGLPTLHH